MNPLESRKLQSVNSSDLNTRELLAPLFRRKRLVGLTFLTMLVVAGILALTVAGSYETTMEILVSRQRMEPMVTPQQTFQTPPTPPPLTEEEVNSEIELLKSGDLLKEVVLANNLQESEKRTRPRCYSREDGDDWYVDRAVERLGKKLSIEVVKQTNVIEVSYKAREPKIAYGVVKKFSRTVSSKAPHSPAAKRFV